MRKENSNAKGKLKVRLLRHKLQVEKAEGVSLTPWLF